MKILQISYDDVAIRDEQLRKIEELILLKENMLLNKKHELNALHGQNKFLDSVKGDYDTYIQYILKQKEEQMTALHLLNNYIEKLIMSGELQKYDIQDAKIEQKKILKEMNSIKFSLSNIMGKATNIDATINNNIKRTTRS